jgi:predicted RNase H-like nuclease (RuvC/YqgF family)
MQDQSFANIIMEFEQKKLPYFNVSEIEIIKADNTIVKYRIKISSKYDTKRSKWEPSSEIDVSKLVTELRDEKLKIILEN